MESEIESSSINQYDFSQSRCKSSQLLDELAGDCGSDGYSKENNFNLLAYGGSKSLEPPQRQVAQSVTHPPLLGSPNPLQHQVIISAHPKKNELSLPEGTFEEFKIQNHISQQSKKKLPAKSNEGNRSKRDSIKTKKKASTQPQKTCLIEKQATKHVKRRHSRSYYDYYVKKLTRIFHRPYTASFKQLSQKARDEFYILKDYFESEEGKGNKQQNLIYIIKNGNEFMRWLKNNGYIIGGRFDWSGKMGLYRKQKQNSKQDLKLFDEDVVNLIDEWNVYKRTEHEEKRKQEPVLCRSVRNKRANLHLADTQMEVEKSEQRRIEEQRNDMLMEEEEQEQINHEEESDDEEEGYRGRKIVRPQRVRRIVQSKVSSSIGALASNTVGTINMKK